MAQTVSSNPRSSADADAMLDIELRKVFKVFDQEAVVKGINLGIRPGEFFSILGPSGCGKTTTLRLIAGFDEPTAGEIFIQGHSMGFVPPYRRPVNTVFQSYALFSHLTVEENIAFGLKIKGLKRGEIQDRVRAVISQVKLDALAKRYPRSLSGGQQQRVALARALVNQPKVLLLDEPLGALDLKLRKEMQVELKRLHQELGLTFVMVTHDQEEALILSDRIAVMHQGKIEQLGTPTQIYEQPMTQFVAEFIGDTNLIPGRIEGSRPDYLWIKTDRGDKLEVSPIATGHEPLTSGPVVVNVRPEKIQLMLQANPQVGHNTFEARLSSVLYLGTHVHCVVVLTSGTQVLVRQPTYFRLPDNETPLYVSWRPEDCLALPRS